MIERKTTGKTLHVKEDTLRSLQHLKNSIGLRSLSDVVDCLVQLYDNTENFPRSYVEFVDYKRKR